MAPSTATTSVQVAVRIRPPTTAQDATIPTRFQRTVVSPISSTSLSIDASGAPASASANGGAPVVSSSSAAAKKQVFTFDQVHGPTTSQHALFRSTAEPLVNKFMEGFNCTVLAYGQTSSGKTHSMTGVDLDQDPSDPNTGMGIIPRAVATIFQRAREIKADRGATWSCTIKGSFIELYNEDLIDLLSSDDTKREVQIREDKDGHIIWGGLREVTVKSAQEVMGLIHQGSSLRRTNETNMNAQSSRSHAIFSLTLSQRKFTGSGNPPRSSSPLPPAGRSPSRIGRPSSTFGGGSNRVSSPTFGRPPTPSFASAMGRGGLRPSSALGSHGPDGRSAGLDDDSGDWVTVVSKFHFVDLAGSERLKRTAAAGERAKEGISINSGLLALGNVISALGDPSRAKTHTATHIPYRDSKLTRLLQDSLGGNAHTLMIACVSPTEWNVGETVNTLKYANRARNIKNRATISEKEEGWDDMEWLRGMVTRLRKELKSIKEGGSISAPPSLVVDAADGASKKVLQQMVDLQSNYEDLREKFVQRTEELTRLRRELGENHRQSSGTMSGTSKYEEIVGPVIEEYEKTISAMEAELSLNRAALRHTNDLVEEKEEELSAVLERHAATESYLEELRSRLSKVSERESSTEAYIRDLEEKVKIYGDSQITSSESVTDLKREIARFKETESRSSRYITDLETRLAQSDESVLQLRERVEAYEADVQRRQEQVQVLQARLDSLQNDGQNWRLDLEQRERKVQDLERRMEEWEKQKAEALDSRTRLNSVVEEVESAKKSLQINTSQQEPFTQEGSPKDFSATDMPGEDGLIALQQTHTATLADLASVTSKYRDALREISDLAGQISELKLQGPRSEDALDEEESIEQSETTSQRRIPRKASEGQINANGRKFFFREATSVESLHSRSPSRSQSLSQELSSARSRNQSITNLNGFHHHPPSRKGSMSSLGGLLTPSSPLSRDPMAVSPTERSSASLEKEIMRLQEVLKERETEISNLEAVVREKEQGIPKIAIREHPELPDGLDAEQNGDLSPKTFGRFKALRRSLEIVPSGSSDTVEEEEALDKLNELMRSMALKETQHREIVDGLNVELSRIQRQHEELTALSRDQTLNMSNELAALQLDRDKFVAESSKLQDQVVDLQQQLETAEDTHSKFVESLRDEFNETLGTKENEHSAEVSRIRNEYETTIAEVRAAHEQESRRLADGLEETLARLRAEHQSSMATIASDHDASLAVERSRAAAMTEARDRDHQSALEKVKAEQVDALEQQRANANSVLQRTREEYAAAAKLAESAHQTLLQEHEEALAKVRADHAESLETQVTESKLTFERLKDEHAAELRRAEIARQGSVSESQSAQIESITKLESEHALAMEKKEADFAEDLQRLKSEHQRALSRREEDSQQAVEKLKSSHASALASLAQQRASDSEKFSVEQSRLQDELAMFRAREFALTGELVTLKEEHAFTLSHSEQLHKEHIAELQSTHTVALRASETAHRNEVSGLAKALDEQRDEFEKSCSQLRSEQSLALEQIHRHHDSIQQVTQDKHSEELEALEATHATALAASESKTQELLRVLEDNHETALTDAREAHEAALKQLDIEHKDSLSLLEKKLLELQQSHADSLLAAKSEYEKAQVTDQANALATEELLRREYADLNRDHSLLTDEVATLRRNAEELETSHAALNDLLRAKDATVASFREEIHAANGERDIHAAEVETLKAKLEQVLLDQAKYAEVATKYDEVLKELEDHRVSLGEAQQALQSTKSDMDNLLAEKQRQDILLRQLQSQSAANPPPRLVADRTTSISRVNGMVIPPPTPPPTGPPPPPPPAKAVDVSKSTSSHSSTTRTSSSSHDSTTLESPSTSISNGHAEADPKVLERLEDQARQIEEREVMIKTLNKQLSHCESDLQAHMDLVATLETSLGDSEKNVRKARAQATELARERDNLNAQIQQLRRELQETSSELASARRSLADEKQSMEQRLDEERKAKERARAQLDSRMDELQKRKSKFACL